MRRIRILAGDLIGFNKQLIQGFDMYRRDLAGRLGLRAEVETYDSLVQLEERVAAPDGDMLMLMPRFSERADDLCDVLVRAREAAPERRLVFLDSHDQTSTPHFPVLPHVDRYVKSKMLRNVDDYQTDYGGGYVFSDWYARQYDFDLEDWHFGSIPDPAYADRIVSGWNFAVMPRLRWIARADGLLPRRLESRPYEINLRFALPARDVDREWYQDYRLRCREATDPLKSRFQATREDRVNQLRFLYQLRQSRAVFSPFGWGEVCWRDYEAVACGALLIKPSMEHLVTTPDIFVAGETYVATQWDNSDLAERVEYYLANLDEAQEIANNASRALRDYFERGGFVDDVRRTILPVFETP
jgi:hypothetical protein